MASDPRESITVAGLRVTESPVDEVWIVGDSRDEYWAEAGRADWPDLVAFAKAILAADEAWLDSQTPTWDELDAKYPDWDLAVYGALACPVAAYARKGRDERPTFSDALPDEKAALRWLAAELEKENGGT